MNFAYSGVVTSGRPHDATEENMKATTKLKTKMAIAKGKAKIKTAKAKAAAKTALAKAKLKVKSAKAKTSAKSKRGIGADLMSGGFSG